MIDKTRGAVLLSSTGENHVVVKLHGKTVDTHGFFTFEIVDPHGNRYFFDLKETTHSYHRNNELNMNYTLTKKACDEFERQVNSLYDPSFDYTSSWLLTKIITSKNQEVTFEYGQEDYQLPTQESVVKYNMIDVEGNSSNTISSHPQYSCSKLMIEAFYLKRIVWDAGSVSFITTSREDIKTWAKEAPSCAPQKLDGILIKDRMGNIVKGYSFSYKYMGDGRKDTYAHVYKRLMLTSVFDTTDKSIVYSMEYFAGDLPAKNSNDIDTWGYSNGVNQGAGYYFPASYGGTLYQGADKTPNLEYMRVGTLQKLRYPTGEEQIFEYETNTDKTPSVPISKKVTCGLGACYLDKVDDEEYLDIPRSRTSIITIDTHTIFEVYGYARNLLSGYSDQPCFYDNETYPVFRVYRIKKDGSKNEDWYYSLVVPTEMINASEPCTYPIYMLGLPAGTYSFEIYAPVKEAYFNVIYSYVATTMTPEKEIPVGGLRIKEIDGAEKRTFSYSGYNELMPQRKSYIYSMQYFQDASYNYSQKYLVQNSLAFTPLSTLKDGYVYGYNSVKETCGKYSVLYEYINEIEEAQEENYPFIPTELNCKNGLLTKKTIYEWNTLKQIEEYDYDTFGYQHVFGFVYKPYESRIHPYIYNILQPLLGSMSKKTYCINGVTEEETYYSYNANYQLNRTSIETSSGLYATVYLYASDKDDELCKRMTEANIISTPMEIRNLLDGKIISATKTEYNKYFEFYAPSAQYRAEINTPIDGSDLNNAYVKKNDIKCYSSYGNPREIVTNGTPTVLIWSYFGMYPIAQIKNCSYSELCQYVSENTLNLIEGKYQPTETDWKAIEGIRTILPMAEVVTMEYRPFFGTIRQTDQRGFTTHFAYDNVGRLIESYFYENGKKMVLKKHLYHYQTE